MDIKAYFSPCRKYRYFWSTTWEDGARFRDCLAVIGLNPSTADETKSDPTVTRCMNFARRWGLKGLIMLNLFAYRATVPKDMMSLKRDPVGDDNNSWISAYTQSAGMVLAAWGVHGAYLDRGEEIVKMVPNLFCLGLTQEGFPRHPLYVRADTKPQMYLGQALELKLKTPALSCNRNPNR